MTELGSSLSKKRSKEANQARLAAPSKFCGGCGKTKDKSEFGRSKGRSDGLRGVCKTCHNARNRRWLEAPGNKDRLKRLISDWAKRNPDKVTEKRARFDAKAGAEYWSKVAKRCRERNPERAKENQRRSQNKIRATVLGRLNTRIRNYVYYCLRSNKTGRTFDLLDFTLEELKLHIERQFSKGMDWAAFMRGEIHLDHIRPLDQFYFESPDSPEFKQAWALTNLQPLWARDNLKKNAKRLYLI